MTHHTEAAAQPVAKVAYVGLGANLGDAVTTLHRAVQGLSGSAGVGQVRCSRLYRSAPLQASGPWYCNAVAQLHTTLSAHALWEVLHTLEQAAGRQRPYRNAPRTLDLDLLLYGNEYIDTPQLTVPHPRWRQRAFVLIPLQELAPERVSAADLAAVADQAIELWRPLT